MARFRGRVIVGGSVVGEAVVVESISFYGDVDPNTGVLVDGRSIAGKILVAHRSRGSTVGSYIMYSLARSGVAPKAIILSLAEPIIVAGAVISSIPLIDRIPGEFFSIVRDGDVLRIDNGIVELLEAKHSN